MIGGYDMALCGPWMTQHVEYLLRELLRLWPLAWVDSAVGPRLLADVVLCAVGWDEVFVYRDARSLEAWTTWGHTEEYGDAMVYLIVKPDEVTAVVGSKDCAAAACVRGAFAALRERWEAGA